MARVADKVFGQVLQEARKRSGLSQDELAVASRVHRTYISQLERGLKSPSLATLLRIARALKHPASEMLQAVEAKLL